MSDRPKSVSGKQARQMMRHGAQAHTGLAIDFYSRKYGLPHAMCGHNSYWLWGGMQGYTSDVLIVLGGDARRLQKYFEEVTERARSQAEYIQPIHNDLPIFVVRKPKQPLSPLWPRIKSYI